MVYVENRQQAQLWARIARIGILIIIIVVVIVTSGTPKQWIKIPGENTIARIWLSASLLITLLFTCWLNYNLAKDNRYHKEYSNQALREELSKHRGHLSINNAVILIWTVLFMALILSGVIEDTLILSAVSGPALVSLVLLFDRKVLKMEKSILDKDEPQENEENIKAYETAKAVVRHLDLPILIGVSLTFCFCMLLSSVETEFPSFIAGFASGATGMQIIVGNVAFEFIHG